MSRTYDLHRERTCFTLRRVERRESWDIAIPLNALLEQKRWSHARLAREAGLTRTDVTRMLRTDPKRVLRVGRARANRIANALEVTTLDLGLPPEEGDGEALSYVHRLAALEAEVDLWKGLVLEALAVLDLQVHPEADQGSRVQRQAPRRRRGAA